MLIGMWPAVIIGGLFLALWAASKDDKNGKDLPPPQKPPPGPPPEGPPVPPPAEPPPTPPPGGGDTPPTPPVDELDTPRKIIAMPVPPLEQMMMTGPHCDYTAEHHLGGDVEITRVQWIPVEAATSERDTQVIAWVKGQADALKLLGVHGKWRVVKSCDGYEQPIVLDEWGDEPKNGG